MPAAPRSRRTPWGLYAAVGAFVVVSGVGATAATMLLMGFSFLAKAAPPRVRLPANFRPIEAYAQVLREDLIHPEKRAIHTIELAPEQVVGFSIEGVTPTGEVVKSKVAESSSQGGQVVFKTSEGQTLPLAMTRELGGVLLNPSEIIGRVVASDKSPNFAFKEESFLPKGTRPGLAAGIPVGMNAITIETSKISGLHGLKRADKVDLIAAVPREAWSDFDPPSSRTSSRMAFVSKLRPDERKQTTAPRVVAEGVVVVRPVFQRAKAETSSTLTQGKRVQAIPVEETVLAIQPDDVAWVELAMQRDYPLMAVAQTSRPVEPESEKQRPAAMVEVLRVARPIAAFSALSDGDFIDPKSRRNDIDYIDPDTARQKKVVPVKLLPGRVVRRPVEVGEIIVEDDLLPIGTRPGVGAGVAPDRQAISLSTEGLAGVELLNVGDHVDLIGSFKLDVRELRERTTVTRNGAVEERETSRMVRASTQLTPTQSLGGRSEYWHLAIDAVVIGAQVGRGESDDDAPSIVTLAVHPRDAESIVQSLARDDIKMAVAIRSTLPSDVSPEGVPDGFVRVPVSGEHLRAFRPMNGWSATVRKPIWTYLPAEHVKQQQMVTDLASYAGRVLKRNIAPGEYFVERDFLPPGSAAGVSGAIPKGMRAILIGRDGGNLTGDSSSNGSPKATGDRVKGLENLEPEQRVDLFAARVLRDSEDAPLDPRLLGRAQVLPLVRDAIVLQTYHDTESDGVIAAMLAVRDDQAAALSEAMATADELRILTASTNNQETAPQSEPAAAGFDPLAGSVRIEQIVGSKKRVRYFPAEKP